MKRVTIEVEAIVWTGTDENLHEITERWPEYSAGRHEGKPTGIVWPTASFQALGFRCAPGDMLISVMGNPTLLSAIDGAQHVEVIYGG